MKKLRVLHIIDSMGLGGAQSEVLNITEGQQDFMSICALRRDSVTMQCTNTDVLTFPSNSRYSLYPIISLKKIIATNNISMLHCHLFRSQVFGWILKKLFFPKIVLVFHEQGRIFGPDTFNPLEDLLYLIFLRIADTKVNKYFACSNATAKKLHDRAGIKLSKIVRVYNSIRCISAEPIDFPSRAESNKNAATNIDAKQFTVGFAGRIIKRKGWREFINAGLLLSSLTDMRFLIAGTGSDTKGMLQLIRKYKAENYIKYLGYISNMSSFYRCLDCFVIPSLWEPMGLTLIEAQQEGVPVIASDVDGLNELISKNESGLLFKAGDSDSLSAQIEVLYKQPDLRRKYSQAGLRHAISFSSDIHRKEILSVYNQLLN